MPRAPRAPRSPRDCGLGPGWRQPELRVLPAPRAGQWHRVPRAISRGFPGGSRGFPGGSWGFPGVPGGTHPPAPLLPCPAQSPFSPGPLWSCHTPGDPGTSAGCQGGRGENVLSRSPHIPMGAGAPPAQPHTVRPHCTKTADREVVAHLPCSQETLQAVGTSSGQWGHPQAVGTSLRQWGHPQAVRASSGLWCLTGLPASAQPHHGCVHRAGAALTSLGWSTLGRTVHPGLFLCLCHCWGAPAPPQLKEGLHIVPLRRQL